VDVCHILPEASLAFDSQTSISVVNGTEWTYDFLRDVDFLQAETRRLNGGQALVR
jgi:hypothetical protein